jgi:hypothetical protein
MRLACPGLIRLSRFFGVYYCSTQYKAARVRCISSLKHTGPSLFGTQSLNLVPSAEVCWIEHIIKLLVVVKIYSAQPLKPGGFKEPSASCDAKSLPMPGIGFSLENKLPPLTRRSRLSPLRLSQGVLTRILPRATRWSHWQALVVRRGTLSEPVPPGLPVASLLPGAPQPQASHLRPVLAVFEIKFANRFF